MILLVTNKHDFTADRVVAELQDRQAAFVRLNTEDFPMHARGSGWCDHGEVTAQIDLGSGRRVRFEELSAIWYRRPEPSRVDPRVVDAAARRFARRESAATLHAFLALADRARWVNHPDANRSAEHRLVQLAAAIREGFLVPRTLVTNDPDEASSFCRLINGSVVAKSVGRAFIDPRDHAHVYTSTVLPEHLRRIGDVGYAPVVLQERIDKCVEVRVTVVGDRVLAAQIDSQASPITRDDWRRDVFQAPHRVHQLPDELAERCRRLTRRFALRFATLDLINTPDDRYVFLELNPNGEWDWIEGMTGLPIAGSIADLLVSD